MRLSGSAGRLLREVLHITPGKALASVAVTSSVTVMEGVSLVLLIPLLQLVGLTGGAPAEEAGRWLGRVFAVVSVTPSLAIVLVIYVATACGLSMLQRLQASLNVAVQQDAVRALRTRTFAAVTRARWEALAGLRGSRITHVLTAEVDRAGAAVHDLLELAVALGVIATYTAVALRVSPSMTMLVLAAGAVVAATARAGFGAARSAGDRYSSAMADLYAVVAEHVSGLKAVKSAGNESRQEAAFSAATRTVDCVGRRMSAASARTRQRMTIGSAVVLAAIVYVSHAVLDVPAAVLLLMLFLFGRLFPRVMSLPARWQSLCSQLPAADAVLDFEAECLRVAEPIATGAAAQPFQEIRLEGVSFTYPGADRPAVTGVTVSIPVGRVTAIAGPSGAGKTTLADLVAGMLSPAAGRVLLDGVTLSSPELRGWRKQVAYVTQDAFFFHDTVRANLLWAKPDATDAEIERALHGSVSAGFVSALAHGLDTSIGDRGTLLSGGERQRLSLARALLRRPRLLILDEATSSVDSENEALIHSTLAHLDPAPAIVVITHRLLTIRDADVIHVLEDGALVQSGTWLELMARDGRFLELCGLSESLAVPA